MSLFSGQINSPSNFRTAFELHGCQSGQLARMTTLDAVFRIYLTNEGGKDEGTKPSQWAWLSGQVGHMLAAIHDAGPSTFHRDIPDFGNVIQAYCLVELGQLDEARRILSTLTSRSEMAVVHAIKALVQLRLGERQGATDQMVKAIRRGVTRSGFWMTGACLESVKLYLQQASPEEAIEVMRKGGDDFLRLFSDRTRQDSLPRLSQIWTEWLATLPASVSTAHSTYDGLRVQRIHFSIIASFPERSREALELFINMRNHEDARQHVLRHVKTSDAMSLFKHLVEIEQVQAAMFVLNEIRQTRTLSRDHISNCLYRLSLSKSDATKEMEETWTLLNATAEPTSSECLSIARLRSTRGDLTGTIEAFANLINLDAATGHRKNRLLLRAAVQGAYVDEALQYLELVVQYKPEIQSFNPVLEMLIRVKRDDRALALFQTVSNLLPANKGPNNHTYTSIVGIYSRRRDLRAVENILQTMMAANVDPDAATWSAMLNAHVESGDWVGVVRRWEAIPEEHKRADSVVATGMKAMVLQSLSFSRVLAVFRSIEQPTTRHWSLVMQSASDHQNWEAMEGLFQEMQAASQQSPEAANPSVYTWSIVLHAYLRAGHVKRSRAIYDEMLSAGIIPSSVTYSMIIKSYAADGQPGTLQRAQDFAMSIYRLANLPDAASRFAAETGARGRLHENLLSPLVIAAGQAGQPELAGEYFDLVAEKAEPSLPLYTQYLDAWRKAGDLHMVKSIWAELFALACRTVASRPSLSTRRSPTRTPENALCIPLSIVLITLGKQKRLLDIKETWNAVRTAGFGFDVGNFNHLAVSLARSGDVEGAFDVVENVLIESDQIIEEESTLQASIPDATDPSFRPPNRRLENLSVDSTADPVDMPEPMNVLEPTMANDALWAPHFHTIATLDTLISQLESSETSRAWLGLMSEETEAEEDSEGEGSPVELKEFGTCVRDPNTGQPKKTTAKGLLMKLNRKYAKAMALVMFHRKKQASIAQRKVTRKGSERKAV